MLDITKVVIHTVRIVLTPHKELTLLWDRTHKTNGIMLVILSNLKPHRSLLLLSMLLNHLLPTKDITLVVTLILVPTLNLTLVNHNTIPRLDNGKHQLMIPHLWIPQLLLEFNHNTMDKHIHNRTQCLPKTHTPTNTTQ